MESILAESGQSQEQKNGRFVSGCCLIVCVMLAEMVVLDGWCGCDGACVVCVELAAKIQRRSRQ